MPLYRYTALNSVGGKVQGSVESPSAEGAVSQLYTQGLMVSRVELDQPTKQFFSTKGQLDLAFLEAFTTEVALLLRNGVRIDDGLLVLRKNASTYQQRKFLGDLLKSVREGNPLSHALQSYEDLVGPNYINLIRTGELSGRLGTVFQQLADDLKYRQELKAKIVQALTYPAVISLVCVICILFVFNYIVPQLEPLFSNMASLPSYTLTLIAMSEFMAAYQWYVFASLAAIGLGLYRWLRKRESRDRVLSTITSWPLVGSMLLHVNRVQANSTLAITLASGVSVDTAVGMAARSVTNRDVQLSLLSAQEKVRRGESFSNSVRDCQLYTDFAHSLIEVGEESGDLEPCFRELTVRARSDFELKIAQMTSLLEPVLILVMGGIVGGVVVTMLLSVVAVNDVAL